MLVQRVKELRTLEDKIIALADKVLAELNHFEDKCYYYSQLDTIARKLGAELYHGASRWAFVFKGQKAVFKFARYTSTDTDYCELEARNYNLAKKYGIERCLLPIEYVGTTDTEVAVYYQPMFDKAQGAMPYREQERIEQKLGGLHNAPVIRKIRRGCYDAPERLWLERATQIYGKRFMREFERWTHEAQVNDLHNGNVGYIGRQPIIIDYAGYHG